MRNSIENTICKQFVKCLNNLKHLTNSEFIYFHVPNEVADNNPRFGAHLKQMGKKAGVPDYIFLWKDGWGCLEFKKSSKEKLSLSQQDFKTEVEDMDNPHYEIVWDVECALKILEKWGILKSY